MGMTAIRATVQRPDGQGRKRRVTFLVDSGAIYSVLPESVWKALRLAPEREAEFVLADGTTVGRKVAEARFTIAGVTATSPVVCGEARDGALLGAVTLETLGLMLNPLNRDLLPMRLLLARASGPTDR
jgi:predicted aspartyl protease